MREINSIVLHCYGKGTDKPQFDNIECCRDWHTLPKPHGNGWSDIGYHFVITKDGAVHKGRPIERKGAHEPKMNANSIGVCFTGDKKFTDRQYKSSAALIKTLMDEYGIKIEAVHGHYEFSKKTCPNYDVDKFKKHYM